MDGFGVIPDIDFSDPRQGRRTRPGVRLDAPEAPDQLLVTHELMARRGLFASSVRGNLQDRTPIPFRYVGWAAVWHPISADMPG